MTVWVLGDQLTRAVGPLSRADTDERVLMIEAHEFARRHAYHPHKLTVLFSAMRHLRDELREVGFEVAYHQAGTFEEALAKYFEAYPGDSLTVMNSPSYGAADRLTNLVEQQSGSLEVVANETFLCSEERFDAFAEDEGADSFEHESFYRMMRRETGYLMNGGEPEGGEWNLDEQNRKFPGEEYGSPEIPTFEPDRTTEEVIEWVSEEFDEGYESYPYGGAWADPEGFFWPVTREEAEHALDVFIDERLDEFGPYQDAMLTGEPSLNHALLSVSLNLGLLLPETVIERVIQAYQQRDLELSSVEGFVRQVLGWREFMRHTYRYDMPGLADANQLNASEDLPEFYWSGETEMACLADVVDGVRKRGYSHHIERLMVLSNFALTYGVRPKELNEWFHAAYVDAYHWVTTPNVIEMGMYGSGVFATKPYASSANYINEMSDYCSNCEYAHTKTTGENACPFNALYWDFLGRNEGRLRSNHRMSLVYSHWDNKDGEEREGISERAAEIRELAAESEL
jgi:deoxyribodipyrimidine photolyase-related protein